MTVRWGILSTAAINRLFIVGARQAEGVEIRAVASREPGRAERFAHEHAIPRAHGDYEELLADPDVDAVYIPLPNAMHMDYTLRALRAGKHVLCEKPLGRRSAEVEEAFDTAEREGRLVMEGFMYRHHPQTVRLKRLLEEGVIGRPRVIQSSFGFRALDPSDIRLRSSLDGGGLMDVGCYCVNASRFLAGEPERVGAEQVLGGDGVDVVLVATLRFPDDVLAHFDAGLALAERDHLEVIGELGSLYVEDPWHCRRPGIELRRDGRAERIELPPADSYRLEAENMSAAIRGEQTPLLGRVDAVGQARTLEALLRSAETGRTVTL